jgi:hypothetical protein
LKTLEKLNRKANRNSLEIEKANLAQLAQVGQSCARARPPALTGGPRLSACLATMPSLSLPRGPELSAPFFPPRPLSLSVPPSPPISLSSNCCPRSPRRGLAHDRTFSGHVRAPAPLLSLAPYSPTSPLSFAPSSPTLSPSLSRSTHTCREPHHRPPSTAARSVATVAPVPRPVPR